MNLEKANPFDLVPNPWNANHVDRENFEKLKKSLGALGNFKPVIVRELDGKLEILAGYHRTEAAKELGMTEIPILNLGEITEQRAKEITLVDNTRYGKDDEERLELLINSMDTELIGLIIPETEDIELPDIEDEVSDFEEKVMADATDDGSTTLKFKYYDLDKADEIEDLLLMVAKDNGFYFADGYANLSDALYHALIIRGKD